MKSSSADHEKIFSEICGKLNELSQRGEVMAQSEVWSDRLERMQNQLKKSQEELISAQAGLHEKIKTLDTFSYSQSDVNNEIRRLTEQLEQERINNSKLSTDLAKSLELNLKLQFEAEEIRSKANQLISEERKHNQYLTDKNKSLAHELDLSQALCNESRLELSKAKDKFQSDISITESDRINLVQQIESLKLESAQKEQKIADLDLLIKQKEEEVARASESLMAFENHSGQQTEALKNLSQVAEKKMIELKMALDKKTIESQDYYSHLQQALTQVAVLRQENAALKDYIAKLTVLHNQAQAAVAGAASAAPRVP